MRRKKFIELNSDNFQSQLCTPRAYKELRLQMSTGDFHTHERKIVLLSERQIDKRRETILWDVSRSDLLKQYIQEVKEGVSDDISFKEFLEFYETAHNFIVIN